MQNLFEKQDSLNMPVECFIFDSSREEFPVKPHWHYFAEFIYMQKSSAIITAEGESYTLKEGEFMLLHPSAVHSIFPENGELPVYAVLKFDLVKFRSHSSYSPAPAEIFRAARGKGMQIHFDKTAADEMRCGEIFSECAGEMEGHLFGRDMVLRAEIYRLLYYIIRKWTAAGLNISEVPHGGDSYGIENITEYIDSRLDENMKVTEIAARCHMSYSNFALRFKELYGMTCKEYIERMRIFKAEEYLLFTELGLGEISRKTGFSDQSHFIKSFRKLRGMTPKQYRDSNS